MTDIKALLPHCAFVICVALSPGMQMAGQSLLDSTSKWKQQDVSCFGGTCGHYNYTITLPGDTLIDGLVYFLPLRSGIASTYNFMTQMFENIHVVEQQLSPIREENGVLYRYHLSSGMEIPIHNFNLSVGDTAITSSSCTEPQVVGSIDTVYVGNSMRRRYFFIGNAWNYLIEGVGSSNGLFQQPCSGIFIESSYTLECYAQNDAYLRIDTTSDCNELVAVTSPHAFINMTVRPNPCSDVVELLFPETQNEAMDIAFYTLDGKFVMQYRIQNPGQVESIDISTFPPAMYVLTAHDSQQSFTTRIVIIK